MHGLLVHNYKMSKTYVSIIVLLLSSLGTSLTEDQLTDTVLAVAQVVSAVVGLVGRWQAGGINWLGVRE